MVDFDRAEKQRSASKLCKIYERELQPFVQLQVAPESMIRDPYDGRKADYFQLGLTLHHLLYNRELYVWRKDMRNNQFRVRAQKYGRDEAADDLITRLTQENPEERLADADEVRNHAFVKGARKTLHQAVNWDWLKDKYDFFSRNKRWHTEYTSKERNWSVNSPWQNVKVR